MKLRFPDIFVHKALKSPVPSLLRSNGPPSDKERSLIRQAIESAEASLKDDDEKESLANFVRTHKAILSPSRRLPSELIFEIFRYYIENLEHSYLSEYTPPWALTHVCSRWRQIAVNTHML